MAKIIGPAFGRELELAGLSNLPISWGDDGVFGLENLTVQQRTAVEAVIAAHDPDVEIPKTAIEIRKDELLALPTTVDLIDKLRNATPAQIDTWLTNNVTTLAQARTVLGTILKYMATRI